MGTWPKTGRPLRALRERRLDEGEDDRETDESSSDGEGGRSSGASMGREEASRMCGGGRSWMSEGEMTAICEWQERSVST